MQFSKFMPLVCAAAFCAGFICARAEDNPAQAAARAALEEKMRELDAQDATNAEAPAVNAGSSGAATAQPSQSATSAPAETQPSANIENTPPPIVVTSSGVVQDQPAAKSSDTDAQSAAKAALDKKMQDLNIQDASTNAAAVPTLSNNLTVQTPPAPAQSAANYPGKELGLQAIEAPAPPVSQDKLAQLQALLARYMADQVSPEEYHKQRAAILAAP
jgi:hypothetical protein